MSPKKADQQLDETSYEDHKSMFRMIIKRLQSKEQLDNERWDRIDQQLSVLNSKLHHAEEWIDIRSWTKLSAETKNVAIEKCKKGTYRTKERSKKGDKWYIHRSELIRHQIDLLG